MGELSKLPNISKAIEQQLNEVGIETVKQLMEIGSKQAWIRVKEIDEPSCINKLYALEGAIEGIRWHYLAKEIKDELKEFYDFVKRAARA